MPSKRLSAAEAASILAAAAAAGRYPVPVAGKGKGKEPAGLPGLRAGRTGRRAEVLPERLKTLEGKRPVAKDRPAPEAPVPVIPADAAEAALTGGKPAVKARTKRAKPADFFSVPVELPAREGGMLPPPNTGGPPRVLAIDPALRNTGWAVLERQGQRNVVLAWGVIRNAPKLLPSSCLVEIARSFREITARYRPNVCAVEATIYVQNFQTAITLGAARGAALVAVAEDGLEIYEYPPRRVKQAVVGRGNADKAQVAFMVRTLLGLSGIPPHDAADALAIGITHLEGSCIRPGASGLGKEKVRC